MEGLAVDELLARAEDEAREGRVKATLVVDDNTRVKIDARHGKAKVQKLDEATVKKMMGGKDRPLRPDRSGALLRTIGIANADGSISARNAKKYKQVNHLVGAMPADLGARPPRRLRPRRCASSIWRAATAT